MIEDRKCPICGGPLEREAPDGPCPVCIDFNPVPEKIGPHKIVGVLGEGSFGVVYRAEAGQEYDQQVALKVIKPGQDTKAVIKRFKAEQQALALMNHPNIAKILSAGVTEEGRPYFVMELVEGLPIDKFCDKQGLTVRQRLELFREVCDAVQHAHQKLVLHRDIKPSNVLVSLGENGLGVPKIIDFGIAKALAGQRLTDHTLSRGLGEEGVGSPPYMAPEQALPDRLGIDRRADVYSLGALLYKLLSGTPPFDPELLETVGSAEAIRIICEDDPVRPSKRLAMLPPSDLAAVAKHRQAQPKTLREMLAKDLDWVIMKCLRKDRQDRYASVHALATDVQGFLDGRPVKARPPSQLYYLQKMVRRNKLAFAAAAAVVVSLVLGLALAIHFGIQEKHAREKAEAAEKAARSEVAKNRQITDLDAFIDLEMFRLIPVGMRRQFVAMFDEAAKILERKEVQSQPEVEAHLRMILGVAYFYLGEVQKNEFMFRKVMGLRPRIGDTNQAVAVVLAGCAQAFFESGYFNAAEKTAGEALNGAKASGASWAALNSSVILGLALSRRGDLRGAEMMYREALAMHRSPLTLMPATGGFAGRSTIYGYLLELLQRQNKNADAEKLLMEASKELTPKDYTNLLSVASDSKIAFAEKYSYPGGYFGTMVSGGRRPWKEKTASGDTYYFEELKRDNQFILLHDGSRSSSVDIQLPIAGGESKISTDGGVTWRRWWVVRKQ